MDLSTLEYPSMPQSETVAHTRDGCFVRRDPPKQRNSKSCSVRYRYHLNQLMRTPTNGMLLNSAQPISPQVTHGKQLGTANRKLLGKRLFCLLVTPRDTRFICGLLYRIGYQRGLGWLLGTLVLTTHVSLVLMHVKRLETIFFSDADLVNRCGSLLPNGLAIALLCSNSCSNTLRRLVIQATVYLIWAEHNNRLHNSLSFTPLRLFRDLDRIVRNSILARKEVKKFRGLMQACLKFP